MILIQDFIIFLNPKAKESLREVREIEWVVELVPVEGRVLWDIFLGAERLQSHQPLTKLQPKPSLLLLLHLFKLLLQRLLIASNKLLLVSIATLQIITCVQKDRTQATSLRTGHRPKFTQLQEVARL